MLYVRAQIPDIDLQLPHQHTYSEAGARCWPPTLPSLCLGRTQEQSVSLYISVNQDVCVSPQEQSARDGISPRLQAECPQCPEPSGPGNARKAEGPSLSLLLFIFMFLEGTGAPS